jgi:hypothetical protein
MSDMCHRWVQAGDGNVPGCIPPMVFLGCLVSARRLGEGPSIATCFWVGSDGELVQIHNVQIYPKRLPPQPLLDTPQGGSVGGQLA